MYHRIQKRLEESNLAIGEFPDIVAAGIKDSVLSGDDGSNDGLKELLEFRNSQQVKALEKLWFLEEEKDTSTAFIRDQLIQLCEKSYKLKLKGDDVSIFELPSLDELKVTSNPGSANTISLKILDKQLGEIECNNIFVVSDKMGNSAALLDANHPTKVVSNESSLNLLLNQEIKYVNRDVRPITLAEMNRLDLSYATECEVCDAPDFWI